MYFQFDPRVKPSIALLTLQLPIFIYNLQESRLRHFLEYRLLSVPAHRALCDPTDTIRTEVVQLASRARQGVREECIQGLDADWTG